MEYIHKFLLILKHIKKRKQHIFLELKK